jgi:hypothetical protein
MEDALHAMVQNNHNFFRDERITTTELFYRAVIDTAIRKQEEEDSNKEV